MQKQTLQKISFCVFLLSLLPIFSPSSYAALKPSPWVGEKLYIDKVSHKAGFGVMNFATGWTALLYEPYYEGWKGLGTGVLYTVTNTVGGVLHFVTAPFPFDIPLPEGGISHEYDR